jgi:hypothetical protein
MSGSSGSLNKISEQKIATYLGPATSLLGKIEWQPPTGDAAPGKMHEQRVLNAALGKQSASVEDALKAIRGGEDRILNPTEHQVLYGVRRATQVAFAVYDEYKALVGLDSPAAKLKIGDEKRTDILAKTRTAAAIATFVFARYLQHTLGKEGNEAGHAEHVKLPEFPLDNPIASLRGMLFYLAKNLSYPTVKSNLAVTTTAFFHAELILDEIAKRKGSFEFLDSFADISYGIEGEDFTITGLERHELGVTDIEFNRVEMSSIVGNSDAKHFARRQAERMMAYNFTEKKNVFQELGGFMPVWMGSGKPGTGKSMLIAAFATMLKDYATNLGVPFRFHPLPDNIVDSYQGNTAKNMITWMKPLSLPDSIIFAPIDDAENLFEDRSREHVSEGARAAQGVFLRYTEGAYAINRGNASIAFFTNLPEQIDRAALSRIQGRMVINGAETREDWLDQGQLWWAKRYGKQEGFVNLSNPTDYEYQSAQGRLKSMAEARQTHDVPTHSAMKNVFESVVKSHDPDTHDFFAQLFIAVVKNFPAFSSRDFRNIQTAVDQRVMDFDMPQEWFDKPENFTALDYERQKSMVLELRTANMMGLSFRDIFRQETVKYLDVYATIMNAVFDREVEDYMKRLRVATEAERRIKEA